MRSRVWLGYNVRKNLRIEGGIERIEHQGSVNGQYTTTYKDRMRRVILRYLF